MLRIDGPPDASGVYLIRNGVNDNVYVGSTQHFAKRALDHFRRLDAGKHYSRHMQRAWDKYGAESFLLQPVFLCSPDECLAHEQTFIDKLRPAYNSCPVAGSNRGLHWKLSDESRKRMSAYHSNRSLKHKERLVQAAQTQTDEKRAKLSAYALNRSEAHRQRLAIAHASPETIEKRAIALRGKKRSEETKARMSVSQLEAQNRPEVRAKISAFHKGRPKSEPQLAAMAKAARERSSLTPDVVRTIRRLSAEGSSNSELGTRYSVHRRTIWDIVHLKTWADIT